MRAQLSIFPAAALSGLAAALALAWPLCARGQPLPALGVDPGAVTVSGLSSGGYMAAQFAVAYSASVKGVGVIAGGPYGCSQGSVGFAATKCSCPEAPDGSPVSALCRPWTPAVLEVLSKRQAEANRPFIDAPEHLRHQQVWVLSGGRDRTVDATLVDALQGFYTHAYKTPIKQVRRVHLAEAGHGMPVAGSGVACALSASPFLNDCGFDAAGALLAWLYPHRALKRAAPVDNALLRFDQPAAGENDAFTGLDANGWAYVPLACRAAGARCAVHVAFHGCRQAQNYLDEQGRPFGTTFVQHAGYNEWAEGSGIVILYPQVQPSVTQTPLDPYRYNPKGCWDFWGYTSTLPAWSLSATRTAPPFARRSAPQMRHVKAMVDTLIAAP